MVNVNKENKTIVLYGDIEEDMIAQCIVGLLEILKIDADKELKEVGYVRKDISLYITSYGGLMLDALGLIEFIMKSKTKINTYCTSYIMSAAFAIFLAGEKRYASEGSEIMYHQLSSGGRGTIKDVDTCLDRMKRGQKRMEDLVVSRTKISREKLESVKEKQIDWYMDIKEALELGVVTDVLESA